MNHTTPPAAPKPVESPHLQSTRLFGRAREVTIEHAGEIYRLRLTSHNKLILIK